MLPKVSRSNRTYYNEKSDLHNLAKAYVTTERWSTDSGDAHIIITANFKANDSKPARYMIYDKIDIIISFCQRSFTRIPLIRVLGHKTNLSFAKAVQTAEA